MIKLRSRKGVSGAISAMFVIAIFFIIVVSLFVYTGMLNSYNQVVNERSKMDWERNSEHVSFYSARVGSNKILNVSFSNDGRVMLHLVQAWLTEFPDNSYDESIWQMQYWISKYVSPGETVNDLGYYPEFKRINSATIGDLTSLSDLNSQYYKIKLVTERGNAFVCQVPWPVSEAGGGETSGGYVLQIDNEQGSFQYAYNTDTEWATAFVKNTHKQPPLMYRILILNTSKKDIFLLSQTFMQQMGAGQVGQVGRFFICQPPSDPLGTSYLPLNPTLWTPKNTPPPPAFTLQEIPSGESRYVYFTILPDASGSNPSTSWQSDPNYASAQPVYVSCMLYFQFEGDPEVRNVPTPAILMLLNYP